MDIEEYKKIKELFHSGIAENQKLAVQFLESFGETDIVGFFWEYISYSMKKVNYDIMNNYTNYQHSTDYNLFKIRIYGKDFRLNVKCNVEDVFGVPTKKSYIFLEIGANYKMQIMQMMTPEYRDQYDMLFRLLHNGIGELFYKEFETILSELIKEDGEK